MYDERETETKLERREAERQRDQKKQFCACV